MKSSSTATTASALLLRWHIVTLYLFHIVVKLISAEIYVQSLQPNNNKQQQQQRLGRLVLFPMSNGQQQQQQQVVNLNRRTFQPVWQIPPPSVAVNRPKIASESHYMPALFPEISTTSSSTTTATTTTTTTTATTTANKAPAESFSVDNDKHNQFGYYESPISYRYKSNPYFWNRGKYQPISHYIYNPYYNQLNNNNNNNNNHHRIIGTLNNNNNQGQGQGRMYVYPVQQKSNQGSGPFIKRPPIAMKNVGYGFIETLPANQHLAQEPSYNLVNEYGEDFTAEPQPQPQPQKQQQQLNWAVQTPDDLADLIRRLLTQRTQQRPFHHQHHQHHHHNYKQEAEPSIIDY